MNNNNKTKSAELYTPSGFLSCDIDMERECTCEECQKNIGALLHSLINERMDSIVILNNLWTQLNKLSEENQALIKIETSDGDVIVTGPIEWIDKLIDFDVLTEIKETDTTPNILNNPIT